MSSLDAGSEATIIGVGAAVCVAICTGIVRAATLRSDMHSRWTRRVQFAVAALDEKTLSELEQLRDDIAGMLPRDFDPDFDPSEAIEDPAPLTRRAAQTAMYHRSRTRMEHDLTRIRRLGPVAVGGLSGAATGTAGATLYYAQILYWMPLRVVSIGLLSLSGLVLLVTLVLFVVFHHRLGTCEILAGTDGQPTTEDSQ